MRAFIRLHGYDALALSGADWVEWAANLQVFEKSWERPFLLVVTTDGHLHAFLSELSRPAVTAASDAGQFWADEVSYYADSPEATLHSRWSVRSWPDMVAAGLAAMGLGGSRIAADSFTAPLGAAAQRSAVDLVAADPSLRSLRWVKHPEELETLREAAALSDWAMEAFADELRPGRLLAEADHTVAGKLMAEAARKFPQSAFSILNVFSLANPVSACIHGENAPVDRRVEPDSVVISQISSKLNGLTMELTRPWTIGSPRRELRGYVDCVREAQEAAIAAALPGQPVCGIQAAAHAVIARAGLDAFFRLRAGHGLGVVMHDFPEDLPFADRPLQCGEVYAVEPGLYITGVGGFRFADIIAVRPESPERITRYSKDPVKLTVPPVAVATALA